MYASHVGYGNSKSETRGRSRHQNNGRRVVINREERNVGRKEKNPKEGRTSDEMLTIMLPGGARLSLP